MRFKKIMSLILTGTLMLSLAACGSAPESSSAPESGTTVESEDSDSTVEDAGETASAEESSGEVVTLKVLSANEAIDEVMMQEFMDANPNIKIEYEFVKAADAPTKIAALATAGELPDVFQTQSAVYVDLVKEGMLMDLTDALETMNYEGDTVWKETYEEELLENCAGILKSGCGEMDTYSYGVPFCMTTVAVLYDKTIYDKLQLTVPQTWNEFISNLDALKAAGYSSLAVQNNTCLDWFPRLFWDQ